jgi:hypothetical protein
VLKTKIWANFQRIIELFTQKIVNKFSKIWGRDPRFGKNLFRIPDPGVKKAPDPDPQHWPRLDNFEMPMFLHHLCSTSRVKDWEGEKAILLSFLINRVVNSRSLALALLEVIGVQTRKKATRRTLFLWKGSF